MKTAKLLQWIPVLALAMPVTTCAPNLNAPPSEETPPTIPGDEDPTLDGGE